MSQDKDKPMERITFRIDEEVRDALEVIEADMAAQGVRRPRGAAIRRALIETSERVLLQKKKRQT